MFTFKDLVTYDLVFLRFSVLPITVRQKGTEKLGLLNIQEHDRLLSSKRNFLREFKVYLQCDSNTSFDEFNILTHGNKKYLLGIKGLLIKRNQPVLNKNISFTTLGYVTFIRHGLMSLVSFYCNNCNLYNLSRC